MKKIISILLALVLCLTVSVSALAAESGFNAGLTVEKVGDSVIKVTVVDSDVLTQYKPKLTIPCDFDYATVTLNDVEIASTLSDGSITFVVAVGGTYVITRGSVCDNGHTVVVDAAVAATCTATGLTEGKHCSVCEEILVAQEVVDALGHTEVIDEAVAPTYTSTGLTEGSHCSVCGTVLVAQEVLPKREFIYIPVIPSTPAEPETPVEPETPEEPETPAESEPCDGGEGCLAAKFTDVDTTQWYHEGVDFAVERGLFKGTGDGTTFSPAMITTRGMLVTLLYRLEGEPAVTGENPFSDVAEGQYYTDAVLWASQNGIINGNAGKYTPDGELTREMLFTMLWRYAQYKGYDVSVGEDTNILSYLDANQIAEYAIPAMQWAVGAGYVQGYAGNLTPTVSADRATAATLLMRFCECF